MATADLITAFLNNEMSPENERGFLLTVASSDTLRLELKSHVMLDRMFVAQSERAEVPEAIRGAIFAEAGVSIDTPRASDPAPGAGTLDAGRRLGRSFMNRFVRGGMLVLVASSGFAAGYFSGQSDDPVKGPAPSAVAPSSTPRSTEPAATAPSLETNSPSVVEQPATSTETAVRPNARETGTALSSPNRTNRPVDPVRSEPTSATNAGAPQSAPQQVTPPAADPVHSSGSGVLVEPPVVTKPSETKSENKEEPRMP